MITSFAEEPISEPNSEPVLASLDEVAISVEAIVHVSVVETNSVFAYSEVQ